jgi:P27 family predicted phage terminase small subunit
MGKRGPRPQPTYLKLLRGNPGKEALNKDEPQPSVEPLVPDAPSYLVGYAADEWYRVAEELYNLKLLSRVDVSPLAAYCNAYGVWRTAVETLRTVADRDPVMHGLIIKTQNGNPQQNPLVLTARQAANDMVRFAAEFGFTPAARSRIATLDSEDAASKFGDLLLG